MRAQEAYNLKNKAAATYGPIILTGGKYQLAAEAAWNGGSLALQEIMPDGITGVSLYLKPNALNATAPSSTATASALATAISDEVSTTTVAADVAQLVTDGPSPTQADVNTLNSDWGTAGLKAAIDTWLAAVATFNSDATAFQAALQPFNSAGQDLVNADLIQTKIVPSYTAFAAALAVLVAQGASPTQAKVTILNAAWVALLAQIVALNSALSTMSTDFTNEAAAISGSPQTPFNSMVSDGVGWADLPPGAYQLVYATGTALYASLARVPLE